MLPNREPQLFKAVIRTKVTLTKVNLTDAPKMVFTQLQPRPGSPLLNSTRGREQSSGISRPARLPFPGNRSGSRENRVGLAPEFPDPPLAGEPEPLRVAAHDHRGHHLGDVLARFGRQRPHPVEIPEVALLDGILDRADRLLHFGRPHVISR